MPKMAFRKRRKAASKLLWKPRAKARFPRLRAKGCTTASKKRNVDENFIF